MTHLLPQFKLNSRKENNFRQQFDKLQSQNAELIKLADHISRSNFMQSNQQYSPIIVRLQQELRNGFSAFVESIQEFFVDMDLRLRNLGEALAQHIANQDERHSRKRLSTLPSSDPGERHHANQNIVLKINQTNGDPFQMFSQRIQMLEENLKKTQQNQHRLLNIVEKLNRRTQQQSFQQYSYRHDNANNYNSKIEKDFSHQNKQQSLSHEHSFRVFALQQQPRSWNQSQPFQTVPSKNQPILQRPRFIVKYPERQQKNTSDSQHHRMRYMMHGLYN